MNTLNSFLGWLVGAIAIISHALLNKPTEDCIYLLAIAIFVLVASNIYHE